MRAPSFIAVVVATLALAAPASAMTLPAGFDEEVVAAGLTIPTAVGWAPDGRVYIAEKDGVVRVVEPGGDLREAPLLDLSGHVDSHADRGLLGLAVDADFARNGFLYLLYTYGTDGGGATARLTRVTIAPGGRLADPGNPESVVLGGDGGDGPCPPGPDVDCLPADAPSHAIGAVRAAPDGTLWVSSGDAARYDIVDPAAFRTYDLDSSAGKILRVDRAGRGLPDNPFCPEAPRERMCAKVYAMGFRNPFRFTLRVEDSPPLVGDVGWGESEEVSVLGAGVNFGWPCLEGAGPTQGYRDRPECGRYYDGSAETRAPVWSYPHAGAGAAIVLGPEYTGSGYPASYRYGVFVGDFRQGWIKRLVLDDADRVVAAEDFASGAGFLDLAADPAGNLTLLDPGDFSPGSGTLRRIVHSPGDAAPRAVATASPAEGDAPLTVRLSAEGSSDPDGDALSYAWSFGDGSPPAAGAAVDHTYTAGGTYTARVTVTDARGRSSRAAVRVSVAGPVGPTVRFSRPKAGRPIGALVATVRDPDGVETVRFALARRSGERCRWWSPRRRRFAHATAPCAHVSWIGAQRTGGGIWRASLGARIPRGSYVVLVRARDARGALTDVSWGPRTFGR